MSRRPDRKNQDWQTPLDNFQWSHVQIEVLMDIRDQLRELNNMLSCCRLRRMSDDINKIDRRLLLNGLKLQKRKTP